MKKQQIYNFTISAFCALFIVSCGQSATDSNLTEDKNRTKEIDSSNLMMNIGGSIFSIPSPIQTTLLMSQVGAEFNASMLNSKDNADNYSSDFLKALNLGIYGCDLGYSAAYENNDLSLKYLSTIRNIAGYIDLENAFDETLIERFSNNFSNKDSMLVLVSEAYKGADIYLKENEKDDVAALVIAGGWIEANYLSCMIIKENNNKLITRKINRTKNIITNVNQYARTIGF